MKKMKSVLCILLALGMIFALAACGSSAPKENQALNSIKKSGVLTVALSPDFSPMEFVDSSKEGQESYVGFDVSLAKYLAEELGVQLIARDTKNLKVTQKGREDVNGIQNICFCIEGAVK